ncbi:MAG: hypothetical protein AB8G05_16765 [Oligoflexales bacterium]
MSQRLILCSSGNDIDLKSFESICVLNTLDLYTSRQINPATILISAIELEDYYNRKLLLAIDKSLYREADSKNNRWAPLSIQQIKWRFSKYYQYKLRIKSWLSKSSTRVLTLSSDFDEDLNLAAKAICSELGIQLRLLNGSFEDKSGSKLSRLAPYDLPDIRAIDPVWVTILAGILARISRKKISCEPNKYLISNYDWALFSWSRSITVINSILSRYLNIKRYNKPLCDLSDSIDENLPLRICKSNWPEFDDYDLIHINSTLHRFFEICSPKNIDKIYRSLNIFFRLSGYKRHIQNQETLCSSRLIAYCLRNLDITVDYLPHGLTWEEDVSSTTSSFSPSHVLAMNHSSSTMYKKLGISSLTVSHPINTKPLEPMKPFIINSQSNFLVMLPDWSSTNIAGRPDAFTFDCDLICDALSKFGVKKVDFKIHHCWSDELYTSRVNIIESISARYKLKPNIVISTKQSYPLIRQSDFVFIGSTTGILECIRAGTPFIVVNGDLPKTSVFANYKIPSANSAEELINYLNNLNVDFLQKDRESFQATLQSGPDPLSLRSH